MALAIKMFIVHWQAYRSFLIRLRRASVDLDMWEKDILKWDDDPKNHPLPYEYPKENKSLATLMIVLYARIQSGSPCDL
jgi:hypothetical protein